LLVLRVTDMRDRYQLISSSGTVDYPPPPEPYNYPPPPEPYNYPPPPEPDGDYPLTKLWSDDSYWHMKIPTNAKLHPDSAKMIEWLLSIPEHRDGCPQLAIHGWSDSIWECDDDTPRHYVYNLAGTNKRFGGDKVPIPDNHQHDPQADAGSIIIDYSEEWMYQFGGLEYKYVNGAWRWCSFAGCRWPLYGSGVGENNVWTCGSAGISAYCATIRPEEIAAGVIARPLCCSLHTPKAGVNVYPPAATTDGRSTDTYAIPNGARLQLDPSLNLDTLGLSEAEKIIAKCLQDYGLVVKENAGSFVMYAENPLARETDPWPALGLSDGLLFKSIRSSIGQYWRVVDYSVFGAVEEEF
jgi:hypothetical protein